MSDFHASSILSGFNSSDLGASHNSENSSNKEIKKGKRSSNSNLKSVSMSSIFSDKNIPDGSNNDIPSVSASSIISGFNSELTKTQESIKSNEITNQSNEVSIPISASSFLKKVGDLDQSSSILSDSSNLNEENSKPSIIEGLISTTNKKGSHSSSISLSDDSDNDIINSILSSSLKLTGTINADKDPKFDLEEKKNDNLGSLSDSPPVKENIDASSPKLNASLHELSDILSESSMFDSSSNKKKKHKKHSSLLSTGGSKSSHKSNHSSKGGSSILSDDSILSDFPSDNAEKEKPKVAIQTPPKTKSASSSPYSGKSSSNSPISGMFIADDDGIIINGEKSKKKNSPKSNSPILSSSPSEFTIPELRTGKSVSSSPSSYSGKSSPESAENSPLQDVTKTPEKKSTNDLIVTPQSKGNVEESSGLGIIDSSFDDIVKPKDKKEKDDAQKKKKSDDSDALGSSLHIGSTTESESDKKSNSDEEPQNKPEQGKIEEKDEGDSILSSGFLNNESGIAEKDKTIVNSSDIHSENENIVDEPSTLVDFESSVIEKVSQNKQDDKQKKSETNDAESSNFVEIESSVIDNIINKDDNQSVIVETESATLGKTETINSQESSTIEGIVVNDDLKSNVIDGSSSLFDIESSLVAKNTVQSSSFIDIESSVFETTGKDKTKNTATDGIEGSSLLIDSSVISDKRQTSKVQDEAESGSFIIESSVIDDSPIKKKTTKKQNEITSSSFIDIESSVVDNKASTVESSGFIIESINDSTDKKNTTSEFSDFISESSVSKEKIKTKTPKRNVSSSSFLTESFTNDSAKAQTKDISDDFISTTTTDANTFTSKEQTFSDDFESTSTEKTPQKYAPRLTPKAEFVLKNIYSETIPSEKVPRGKMVTETKTEFSMKPAKRKRVDVPQNVPLFDPMLLSSATVSDVNARYKQTLSSVQQKMMLLDQSLDSLLLTKRRREERPKSHGVSMRSVEKEIEERIRKKKELAKKLEGKIVK